MSRRYRNRRVGEYLKELHLTEGRNTGLRKIVRAMRENGSPDPVFETDDDRTYFLVTLWARELDDVGMPESGLGLTVREERLPGLFRRNPALTIEQAALELEVSGKTVKRDVAALKAKGLLRREGSNKSGSWIASDR